MNFILGLTDLFVEKVMFIHSKPHYIDVAISEIVEKYYVRKSLIFDFVVSANSTTKSTTMMEILEKSLKRSNNSIKRVAK